MERKFTFSDQIKFANFSGDFNPIHCDPIKARRFMHGSVIVHGINLLLCALNNVSKTFEVRMRIKFLDVEFKSPVFLDESVFFEISSYDENEYIVFIKTQNINNVRIRLIVEKSNNRKIKIIDKGHKETQPDDISEEEISNKKGKVLLVLQKKVLNQEFPLLSEKIELHELSILLATTNLVGMKCPGYNSIYSKLRLEAIDTYDLDKYLNYKVDSFDNRFGMTNICIKASGFTGTITAFLRPKPQHQISFIELKSDHGSNQLVNKHALIVGGSRGLGEIAAKFCAAKGAKVSITYNKGLDLANKVVSEINEANGSASCFKYNVLDSNEIKQLFLNEDLPDILFYFATPHIGESKYGKFSLDKYHQFNKFYIDGFYNLYYQLKNNLSAIFYPSTVFISEKPSGMWEYTAAKSAAEFMCTQIEKENKNVTLYNPRLPKVKTDQTISLLRLENDNTIDVMIQVLQKFTDIIIST